MGKSLFIAEKPSVAMEFARALKENMTRHDGYQESEHIVITWCVGHLVTMSYPEAYDEKLKRWSLDTLPFIPDEFKYEVIPAVRKQYGIVRDLLNRNDVTRIYVCTDSGREGEYIYRLVASMAGVHGKEQRRVWIDSQTEEEILRGIREAKSLSEYDRLSDSAYLRAKEDYLMGINFSRLLTLKYGSSVAGFLNEKRSVISVGRVMTCVLGMVVRREREIREFVKQPFFRVVANVALSENESGSEAGISASPENAVPVIEAEFRAVEGSDWFGSPLLYKENGFKNRKDAQQLIDKLSEKKPVTALVEQLERKTEKKNPPLLYNLAELQNDCSRIFHISPDQTLNIAQDLYEKKLVTYPRTDARVLSSAAAKVIGNNLRGLVRFEPAAEFASHVLEEGKYQGISRTRYVDDKQITDHYALIPTGSGLGALKGLSSTAFGVYSLIVKRFLGIFYPPAKYQKTSIVFTIGKEKFFAGTRILTEEGYLSVMKHENRQAGSTGTDGDADENTGKEKTDPKILADALSHIRKGRLFPVRSMEIREGETSPPKRYNSGSIILAMENAGNLIEDESLREQIKGAGIGTSATRAEILKKLVNNQYIALNRKTQILTPTLMGEMIFDVVRASIPAMLNPDLTASWEKGLMYVTQGTVTPEEYMVKLKGFIVRRTEGVMGLQNQTALRAQYERIASFYPARTPSGSKAPASRRKKAGPDKGK